jgi:hypothetical protein
MIPSKSEIHVNIEIYSFFPTGNTLSLHYKDEPVNVVYEIIAVYHENHMEHANTICR